MTTANHTAILATKVAANAATFNAPLGQLDAAIGAAVSTLSTTAKNVVGAINELDALIGTAASGSGSIGTSIHTDGTLKDGAVDVAAVLANNVVETAAIKDANVTAAKIANGALPSPNLCYDPFNSYAYNAPSVSLIDGRYRWKNGIGSRVADAAASSGYSIEFATTTEVGKYLYLTEMGLLPGDVVSCGVSIYVPSAGSRNVRVSITTRDAAYAPIQNYLGVTQAGDDAWHFLAINNITLDALTAILDLNIDQVSGTGTCKIRAWYCYRGSYAFEYSGAPGVQDGLTANRWLQNGNYLPQQNLADDPLNRRLHVAENPDGRQRWHNAVTGVTRIDPDATNPYGLPTMRIEKTAAGRRFWLDEMGLRAGDAISVGVLARIATGTACGLAMYQYDATGAIVTDAFMLAATVTGDDTIKLLSARMADQTTAEASTIQATTVCIDIYTYDYLKSAGTGYVDVYAWLITLGTGLLSTAPLSVAPEGMPHEQWADYPLSQLAYGRQFLRNYTGRAAQILQGASVLTVNAATNANPIEITTTTDHGYLTGNQVTIAAVEGNTAANGTWPVTYVAATKFTLNGAVGSGEYTTGGTATQVIPLRVALLGDSWIDGTTRISDYLTAWLQSKYGDGGAGYVGFGWPAAPGYPLACRYLSGYSITAAGTGVSWTLPTFGEGKGVDLQDITSSTAGAKFDVNGATWTDATIHYLVQNPGGTFEYQVDSDGWVEVATNGAGDVYSTAVITGKSLASHTLTIQIKAGSTDPVTLFGVDLRKAGSACRVLKLGCTGSAASHWAAADSALWTAGLQVFAPHLVVILLGTNDDVANVALAAYHSSMDTLIDRIQAATMVDPAVAPDILILTPADNGDTTDPDMVSYVRELRHIAVDQDAACFDSYKLLGPYATANLRGLYTNSYHINSYGGRAITATMIDELLRLSA